SLYTLPRHPKSTLFPYTTLFRSRTESPEDSRSAPTTGAARLSHRGSFGVSKIAFAILTNHSARRSEVVGRAGDRERGHAASASPDRKSTRLNSSHEWISYAVFCL